jgi:hypothetical protein
MLLLGELVGVPLGSNDRMLGRRENDNCSICYLRPWLHYLDNKDNVMDNPILTIVLLILAVLILPLHLIILAFLIALLIKALD